MGPDAMFYDIWTDTLGAHIDRKFMREAGCNAILRNMQIGDERQMKSYGDKGFTPGTHVITAYHGPGEVTEEMVDSNDLMKTGRVPEEWGFGKMKMRCPLLAISQASHENTSIANLLAMGASWFFAVQCTHMHQLLSNSRIFRL